MTRSPIATRPFAASLLAAILVAACTGGTASAPSASGAPTASPAPASPAASSSAPARPSASPGSQMIPPSPRTSPITGEVPTDIMARVRALLAKKVGGGDAARATVEVAQSVTWPDGSLGCPQPGMMYTQMVVPGYHVVLALDGTKYDYRIGLGGTPSLCESSLPHAASPAAHS